MIDKKVDNLIINKLTKVQYDAIQEKSDTELYLVPDDIVTAQWGVVSQTQTWTQASDGGYDYTMSNLVYGWIPQANIDLYESAGATFNETSGYFELNGLTDISYEEMRNVYRYSFGKQHLFNYELAFTNLNLRTNFNLYPMSPDQIAPFGSITTSKCDIRGMAAYSTIEIFMWMDSEHVPNTVNNYRNISNATYAFRHTNLVNQNIPRLRKVIGYLNMINVTSSTIGSDLFGNQTRLEDINLYKIKDNFSFPKCPRLSVASILFMITNEASTSAITITLHPTAYARAIADSDVQAALQAHTNVSLASA